MKIGDVDPRDKPEHCFTITDKSLAIAGGVLEAVMRFEAGDSLEHHNVLVHEYKT